MLTVFWATCRCKMALSLPLNHKWEEKAKSSGASRKINSIFLLFIYIISKLLGDSVCWNTHLRLQNIFHLIVLFSEYVFKPFNLVNAGDKWNLASLVTNEWDSWRTWKGLQCIPIDLSRCTSCEIFLTETFLEGVL